METRDWKIHIAASVPAMVVTGESVPVSVMQPIVVLADEVLGERSHVMYGKDWIDWGERHTGERVIMVIAARDAQLPEAER